MAMQNEAPRSPPAGARLPAVRVGMAVLVIGAVTLLLRAAPAFDATVEELVGRLSAIHDQAIGARERPDEWRSFATQSSSELKAIADDARRSQRRLSGPWRWIAGIDRREESALKEVQRLADADLPALIAAGPGGSVLREKNIKEAFGRLDDHLAGASPYLPPMRPIENQEGMDRTTGVRQSWPGWLVWVIVIDAPLIGAGLWWWVRRSKRTAGRGSDAGSA